MKTESILKHRKAKARNLYFMAGIAPFLAATGFAMTFSVVGDPPVALLEPPARAWRSCTRCCTGRSAAGFRSY